MDAKHLEVKVNFTGLSPLVARGARLEGLGSRSARRASASVRQGLVGNASQLGGYWPLQATRGMEVSLRLSP